MEVDDYYSFKTPGTIPFKWEIRPGVPKLQHRQSSSPSSSSSGDEEFSFPITPTKLLPPPPIAATGDGRRLCFETGSFRSSAQSPRSSSSSSRSRSFRFQKQQQVGVISAGNRCFPSPLLTKKKKHKISSKDRDDDEEIDNYSAIFPDSNSDFDETILSPVTAGGSGRLSVSSRSSLSPLRDSHSPLFLSPSSFPSYRYSTPPRPLLKPSHEDCAAAAAEWALFGLF